MEPIIIVYTKEEAQRPYDRFVNFVRASFYIGMEYREPEGSGNVKLVKVEMFSASDPTGLEDLKEFTNLLLDNGIDHEVRFLAELPPAEGSPPSEEEVDAGTADRESEEPRQTAYEARIEKLKEMRRSGVLSKKEYKAQRDELLENWRKDVADRLRK